MIFNMQTIDEQLNKLSLLENKYHITNEQSYDINQSLSLMFKMHDKYENNTQLYNYINEIFLNLTLTPDSNIDVMFDKAIELKTNDNNKSIDLIVHLLSTHKFTSYGKYSLEKLMKLLSN